ncbi:hypothetical protein HALLA_18020 [Halostagnicola larsenii XH-48]|uniref:Uncharacterized protein n=1 Tax=Halostagnicola larsenii XH-48 TaxID=797299 RepID=W0JNX1_9EURY|nr:hypothetical protein [Halostagnicola larsenii]AHG00411.1 hypothetical protein HALLA_18020 [Halostagnicola larsenii XH-48]
MSSVETPHETGRGFGISSREARVIGGASVLMAINVALMAAVAETPLAAINETLFQAPIIGVIVYGVAITGGELIAERGVEGGSFGIAFVGMVILQFAFGVFGAGVLSFVPAESRLTVLGVTAVIVAILTALVAGYVYARSKSFDHWGSYATYSFIGGVIAVAVGTFFEPVLLVGFVLIFLGFVLRLGWEIWRLRDRRDMSVGVQTIGVYVAVAGVFVHVLQLVIRFFARE